MSDFSRAALTAAAGLDPWALAQQLVEGNPEAITGVGLRYRQAASMAAEAWDAGRVADRATATHFVNDGTSVFDAASSTARGATLLAARGEKMEETARAMLDVGSALAEHTGNARAQLTDLDADLAHISALRNAAAAALPASIGLDAVDRRYWQQAVDAVARTGGRVNTEITGYSAMLTSRSGNLAGLGYAAAPGERADRRDPDGRDGRRVDNDDRTRGRGRDDPRDHPQADVSNDWAGRAILERYLEGRGDWDIQNDPAWTTYLEADPALRSDLRDRTDQQAQAAVTNYLTTGQADGRYSTTYHEEIENGEGIVGYQYLHGTDRNAGDFGQRGTTQVVPQPDGTYQIHMHNHYQWNDTIDPNPQYSTDRWKSRIAEIITLGRADPYKISIGWDEETVVTVDGQGNVIDRKGYPG